MSKEKPQAPQLYSLNTTTGREANKERTQALWGLWTISMRDYLAGVGALIISALLIGVTHPLIGSAAWAVGFITLPVAYWAFTWRSKDKLEQNILQLAKAKYDNKQQGKVILDGKHCDGTTHIVRITHSTIRAHTPELAHMHYIHDNHRDKKEQVQP